MHLVVAQPQGLQEAQCPGALLGQHDPDQQQGQAQPQHVATGQPAGVDHGVGAVVFEPQRGGEQHDRTGQGHAQPWRGGPPQVAPQRQHRSQPGRTGAEQHDGGRVAFFEGADAVAGRQLEHDHAGQGDHGQAQFEQVQAAPFAQFQQFGGEHPRQRQRQLAHPQSDHHRAQAMPGRKRLDHVVEPQRIQRRPGETMGGAHRDGRGQVVDEDVSECDQRIQGQEDLGEAAQPELLAELDQDQVGRQVGHHVGGRQPRHLVGIGPQRALQVLQVGGDQRIAQAAGEGHHRADDGVLDPAQGPMQRGGGRPRQHRAFVRQPLAWGVLVGHDAVQGGRSRGRDSCISDAHDR